MIAAGIEGSINNLDVDNVVGLCAYNDNMPHQVVIDEAFWSRAGTLRRELIVFHELGHCYLRLGHVDEAHPDGRCKSMMRSGLGECVDVYFNTIPF